MSASTLNHPEPHESFLLGDTEKKITVELDPKIVNAATFTINKEDHTIGNLLVSQLLRDVRVLYAGYKVPHPLENHILVKIQVREGYTPQEVLEQAITDCITTIAAFGEKFQEEVERIKRTEGEEMGAAVY